MIWTTRPRSNIAGLGCLRAGSGPQVLFLHGVGLRADAWNPIIDHYAGRYTVWAPDMLGHGDSPVPTAPHPTLADYTDAAAGLIDSGAVVVGHSMGAMMALDMAIRYPRKIRAVVALNAIFERTPDAAQQVRARAAAINGPIDPCPALTRWFNGANTPEATACAAWLRGVDPAGYKTAYQIFAAENGPDRADLRTLACPAVFITGGREENSTPQMSQTMAQIAPMGRAEIIEDAGHMLPMTHPDRLCAILDGILEGTQA